MDWADEGKEGDVWDDYNEKWYSMDEMYKSIDDTYIAFGTKYHEKHFMDEANNMKHKDFPFARAPELGLKWFGFYKIIDRQLSRFLVNGKKDYMSRPSMQFWWNSIEELLASTYN